MNDRVADTDGTARLQALSLELIRERDATALYQKIVEAAAAIMQSQFASMQMLHPERGRSGELRLLAFKGFDPESARFWEWVRADSKCTCGVALLTGKRVVAADVEHADFMAGTEDQRALLAAGIRAAQTTPLMSRQGAVIGMITTHWAEPHQPPEQALRLLDILARQAADLVERMRAEEALRASEQRYRAVVESQTEMVCRFRPDGTLLFVNGAYARARGTTPEALCAASFWDHIPAADHEGVRAMLARMTPEAPEVSIENRLETVEGERWTLWANRALAFDVHGRVAEAQSTGIDITDRKRAEAALLESDRRKDEFLAILSHELRNPLAPIRNAVTLLREAGEQAETRDQVVPMLERQVGHLIRLVDDLLDVSRINRGDVPLQKRPVRIAEVIAAAAETSRPLVDARRHRLTIDLAGDPLSVMGDPVRLAQVVANLVNNAAAYTPEGGRIEIRAWQDRDAAVVSVSDNGLGISADSLETLFAMFSRGDAAQHHPSGFGIGLALSRRLVELHGGTLSAASDGSGKGSTFTLRLALCAAAPAPAAARTPGLPGGKRILVVDDNSDAADSLGMLLRTLGADVQVAHSGQAALAAFQAEPPAVVLLDIGMPGMDGYEVARAIRARDPERRAALVALTGWGQEADRRRAREAGFDDHLVKPAEIGALQALLSSLRQG